MQTFVKPIKVESFNLTLTHLKNAHKMTWAQLAKRTGVANQTISKYRTAPLSMPMGMVNNFRFAMDLDAAETNMLFDSLCAEIHKARNQMTVKKRDIKAHFKKKGATS